ncbi:MAG: UDP-N-acetylmuramate dehydrogenase [Bacilli bacterium]|nr:UDP-N-acetylmuramate dehydrogenase [Bacilli bacterium]
MKELETVLTSPIVKDIMMRDYTTYKTGGSVLGMVTPKNIDELISILEYAKRHKLRYKVLGSGSNVIFNDAGYQGIIIKMDEFNQLEIFGREMIVGAGYSLMRLAMKACLSGLAGLEFAAGIPGTVGGAVFMNAGAYLSDMGYIVKSVKVLTPDYEVIELSNAEMDFHYRTSFLQNHPDYICLEAHLVLQYGTKEAIMEVIQDRKRRRLASQPLEYPSAGSVFRNPPGDSAGRIIESLGLKEKRVGGAMVSPKHANFIVNVDHATGEDVKQLICEVQKIVKEKTGIELKIEQEFVE